MDDWLLSEMAKQLHLSKLELLRFIQCENGYDKYVNLMIERATCAPSRSGACRPAAPNSHFNVY